MEFLTSPAFSYLSSALILLSPLFLKKRQSASAIAGMTTTFGILGTFVGILFGLLAFNVQNIEGSVPALLEGLKTAFLTSIAGIVAGIVLKIWPGVYGIEVKETDQKEGVDAIVEVLKSVDDSIKKQGLIQTEKLINIERSLIGDGDSTLLTQLQKLRTTFSDKQDELVKEFRDFARNMAENNSKALIEALAAVMRDFNTKINEQFGENFKQLNEAVGRILVWQENYKEQVEQMKLAFEKALLGIEQSERHIVSIRKESEAFTKVAQNLHELISQLQNQKSAIESGLTTFADVAKDAKSAVPLLRSEVTKLTTEFSNTVNAALTEISISITKVKDTVAQQSSSLAESQRSLTTGITQVTNTMAGQIDRLMKENTDRISKQVEALDRELGEELKKSLGSLSSQLASLSTKFVQDYSPLTNQLREVVQLARTLKN